MLKQFKYTKANGEESERIVYPLRLVEDKLLAIDLTPYSPSDRREMEAKLDAIHREYLDNIYSAGFKDDFRSFFMEQIS
jgi:hypothetical protein